MPATLSFVAAALRLLGGLFCSETLSCDETLPCDESGGFTPAK